MKNSCYFCNDKITSSYGDPSSSPGPPGSGKCFQSGQVKQGRQAGRREEDRASERMHETGMTGQKAGFREYADYMRQYFRTKVQKIPVNAGCTCPNRDGTISRAGCVYCNNHSFSPAYGRDGLGIAQQLEAGKRFYAHKYPVMKYLAYFQSHTNTYGDADRLIRAYDEALAVSDVAGLVVATRPDCMSERLLDYFAQVARSRYVCIEYGVESVNNSTLRRIRRGHDVACAADAIRRTAARQIQVGVHFILGLPGDTRADWLEQARWVSALPVNLLKLHQLQVIRGTPLAAAYGRDPSVVTLFSAEAYAALVAEYLEHLSPDVVVERFTSQAPSAWVLAPRWGMKSGAFVRLLRARMRERHAWQGRCFQPRLTAEQRDKTG